MAYDGKILSRAMQRYNEDKQRRSAQQEAARARACREEPRLGQIRQTMQGTVGRVLAEAMSRGEDPMPALEALRKENLGLQQERAELLRSHGWPADLMEDKPRCILCGDTGFRQGRMCSCLQKYYAREQIEELSRLLDVGSQSFESFDLEWYSCEVGQYGRSPRETMERNLSICRTFAQSFGSDSGNLLLFGAPGLGKTFLSACIARVVSEDGFSVVYDTAMRIFSRFEAAKVRAFDDPEAQEDTERYLRCDLLILQSPWIPVLRDQAEDVVRAISLKNMELRIFCGAEDEDCLPMAKQLYAVTKQAGCNVTLTVQENTRHQFPVQPYHV